MLGQADVVPYLNDTGVIGNGATAEVVDASRRNLVFVVTGSGSRAYVVKQARASDDPAVAREASVLRSLESAGGVDDLIPQLVAHDTARGIIVLATEPGGRNLREQFARRRFSTALARACGRALARLHRLPPGAAGARPPGLDPAWPLSWHRPWLETLSELSAAGVELLRMTQSSGGLCSALDDLRDTSRAESLIHGDVRWDNWIALPAPPSRGRSRIVVADWELAGPGEPAMDVGAVLGEHLLAWLESIPLADGRDPGRLLARALVPLERLRPSLTAFWTAYRAAGGAQSRRRAVRFAAVRLLQAAVEQARDSSELRPRTVIVLQLAANLLERPDDAADRVLRLP